MATALPDAIEHDRAARGRALIEGENVLAHRPASGATWCLLIEHVVEQRAENRADDRRDDRHPPPAAAGGEHAGSPSGHEREQPRAEIARRVDRVAGVEAERDADGDDDAADERTGQPAGGADVLLIGHGEHAGHQQHRADHLIDEPAGDRQERLRIGGEDAGGGRGALHQRACRRRTPTTPRDRSRTPAPTPRTRRRSARSMYGSTLLHGNCAMHGERHGDGRIQVRAGDAADA